MRFLADVDGRVFGDSVSIKSGTKSHLGELGIVVRSGYRYVGACTEVLGSTHLGVEKEEVEAMCTQHIC